ncbi:N-acetylneuraminate epimerase [Vibrio sp. JC009]|uniref:N-acetylneuraminate epimerase n=1 Tax=Vibrio sp. JC009 TaxID=2912314 RepID=UPI0023B16969|nr:N-acetylneuraminate epimerase [Vibrio sp. JC009]WED24983.1 N-acetylneuraminate epimerase [Vibrio sp. JC009]
MNKSAIAVLLASSLVIGQSAFANDNWPDLPVGLKSGVSAQLSNKLYVGLGSAGSAFYMLDLNNVEEGWQKKASFIGPERNGATASVVGDDIFVFGGAGKVEPTATSPVIFNTVYRYNSSSDSWSLVNTTAPVGLLGAASYSPDDETIVFFGGYNKGYFDKYLSDINATDKASQPEKWQKIVDNYMGMKPLDYKWNRSVIQFKPATGAWAELGTSPYIPNCGSALVSQGTISTLVSGEIKPGLRTPEVKQYQFGQPQPWQSLHSLPAPKGSNVQEGVAGAFAGKSNGALIVAGGANFHGAKNAFESGKMFAHNGFSKAFNAEIYVLEDGLWSQSNSLKKGIAYGASFTLDNGVLIVGGEDGKRKATKGTYLLSWNGNSVDIQD